jgi:hypothetical protein
MGNVQNKSRAYFSLYVFQYFLPDALMLSAIA